jgi:hypothetical protein
MSRLTHAEFDEMLRLEEEAKKRLCSKCSKQPALKDSPLCGDCEADHRLDNEAYAEGEMP